MTYADGRLYLQSEDNVVGLAEATISATARRPLPDFRQGPPSWAHPVISERRLYVRNQDTLHVHDIRAGAR